MIERIGSKWVLFSRKGAVLGRHETKADAVRQERAINISKGRAAGHNIPPVSRPPRAPRKRRMRVSRRPRRHHSSKISKSPRQLQAEIDVATRFPREPWEKKIDARRGQDLGKLIAAFKKSPAIITVDRYGHKTLIIRSGEMQNQSEGKLRATMFKTDGPTGHITRNTDRQLAEELMQYLAPKSVRPATDADVMRWTSTAEFARGSKLVAFVQASNTLRYRGSKQGRYDWASETDRRANDLAHTDIDGAIEVLEAGIRELG